MLKENYIKRLFPSFSSNIISFDRFYYRNKVTLHVFDGKLGFYKESTNDLVCVSECLLCDEKINNLISVLKRLDLSNIDEIVIKKGDAGLLLSVYGFISNEDILSLVNYDGLESIYQNDKLIYGNEYVCCTLGDISYNINANSFFQVNTRCAKAMYDTVKEYVGSCDKLLDLYCGTGSIGIYLSDVCKNIVGVEINKDSVRCAKKNILDNNISNYKIICGDASVVSDKFDVVVVDPPRSGLSKDVIANISKIGSNKLIYVSCNPSTLKRDISSLCDYKVSSIKIFNMFPGTKHIESVVLLEKN